MSAQHSTRVAILALIVAHIIWGANSPILKWSLQDLSPFTLGFLRFSIGALILLPFSFNKLAIEKEDIFKIILIGFFLIFLNISFFLVGLNVASSIDAPIIGSSGPIFLILGALFFLREKLSQKVMFGTSISLLGVIIIILRPFLEQGSHQAFIGDIFYLISTIASVIGMILLKKFSLKYPGTTVVFWMFIVGSFSFLPMFFMENLTHPVLAHLTVRSVIGISYAAIFASGIAYLLLTYSLRKLHAMDVGIFNYMDPILTILVAIPLLGEKPTVSYLIGAIFVFAGIYIAEKRIPWHPIHKLRS